MGIYIQPDPIAKKYSYNFLLFKKITTFVPQLKVNYTYKNHTYEIRCIKYRFT